MERAQAAFERGGLDLEGLDGGFEAIRDALVTEHYGEGFFDRLRRPPPAP